MRIEIEHNISRLMKINFVVIDLKRNMVLICRWLDCFPLGFPLKSFLPVQKFNFSSQSPIFNILMPNNK